MFSTVGVIPIAWLVCFFFYGPSGASVNRVRRSVDIIALLTSVTFGHFYSFFKRPFFCQELSEEEANFPFISIWPISQYLILVFLSILTSLIVSGVPAAFSVSSEGARTPIGDDILFQLSAGRLVLFPLLLVEPTCINIFLWDLIGMFHTGELYKRTDCVTPQSVCLLRLLDLKSSALP